VSVTAPPFEIVKVPVLFRTRRKEKSELLLQTEPAPVTVTTPFAFER